MDMSPSVTRQNAQQVYQSMQGHLPPNDRQLISTTDVLYLYYSLQQDEISGEWGGCSLITVHMKLQCKSSCLLGLNFAFQTFSSVIELSFVHMTNYLYSTHRSLSQLTAPFLLTCVHLPSQYVVGGGGGGVMRLQMYLLTLKPHYNSTQQDNQIQCFLRHMYFRS